MKAPEVTEEIKNDMQVMQMRSALDPKHFYKRNEMKTIPKYFEVSFYKFNFIISTNCYFSPRLVKSLSLQLIITTARTSAKPRRAWLTSYLKMRSSRSTTSEGIKKPSRRRSKLDLTKRWRKWENWKRSELKSFLKKVRLQCFKNLLHLKINLKLLKNWICKYF